MDASSDVLTLDDFRDRPADILAELRRSGRPVVLTIDGEASLVVQDAGAYRKLLDTAEEAAVVAGVQRGLEDVKAGRTQPLSQAFDEIRRELGLAGD